MRDMEKAFDKVWTLGLQYKIINLNLPALTEKIVCDYLMDRRATISIEEYTGPYFDLKAGGPQGDVLAPPYFQYTLLTFLYLKEKTH